MKSWSCANAYDEIEVQKLAEPWYFVIRSNKSPSAAPKDTTFAPGATFKWKWPEYQLVYTFYVLFFNQIV
jgi:hypothetical protein